MSAHYVSPSALTEFRKCPKCFWIDRNKKIKKPRGAFPTLPGGFDRILKAYFDGHRAAGTLPTEIADALPGDGEGCTLFKDTVKLTAMRNALRPLLTVEIGNVKLVGGIDDLIVGPHGHVYPFDYKTKGRLIKDEEDPFQYYRMQLNDYGLLLEAHGLTIGGAGFLGYWSPLHVVVGHDGGDRYETITAMKCQVFSMTLDLEAARAEVIAAGKCLDGDLPPSAPSCETCQFIAARGSG